MNIGIILSGGTGNRFNSDKPKQYHILNDKYVVEYSICAMEKSQSIDKVIVVVAGEYLDFSAFLKYSCDIIKGGNTRNTSLRSALEYILKKYPKCKNVIINEAARPMLTTEIVDEYIEKLNEYDCVNTTQKITDSLGSDNIWYVNREEYFLVQAPEAFKFELLYQHFNENSEITATYQQLPENSLVYNNFEFINNIKITYPDDIKLAEYMMRAKK